MVLRLMSPGVIDVCRKALKTFESLGCTIEEDQPDYPLDAVWQAVLRLRGWQQGNALLPFYNDPAKRALLKPEAIFEVEMGRRVVGLRYLRGFRGADRVVSRGASIVRAL